jgi:hypothetical protein
VYLTLSPTPLIYIGHNLTMTEEDYDVHRIMSFFFFAGWGSIPFLHSILQNPSPRCVSGHVVVLWCCVVAVVV